MMSGRRRRRGRVRSAAPHDPQHSTALAGGAAAAGWRLAAPAAEWEAKARAPQVERREAPPAEPPALLRVAPLAVRLVEARWEVLREALGIELPRTVVLHAGNSFVPVENL